MASIAQRLRALLGAVPLQCLLLAGAFCLYHRLLLSWLAATGQTLGIISEHLVPPLHAKWETELPGPWILPAVAVLAAVLLLSGRLFLRPGLGPRRFLTVTVVLFVVIGLSVSMIDGIQTVKMQDVPGRVERLPPFVVPYTKIYLEYIADVPKVERAGLREFLGKYSTPRLFNNLSVHAKTHPPGGVVFQWGVAQVFGHSVWAGALASILFSALSLIVAYALGRELYGETAARAAVALLLVAPNYVMFVTTSMDGPFSVFPALSVWLLVRALREGARWQTSGVLLGLSIAAGSFMTYAAPLFLAVFVALFLFTTWRRSPPRAATMVRVLAVAAGAVIVFYAALAAWSGYDPLAAVRASIAQDQATMGTGHETLGRYLQISVANLMAFLIGVGAAFTAALLRRAGRAARGDRDAYLVSMLLSLPILAFSTLFTLEVERVWLFLVPLLAVAVAPLFEAAAERQRPRAEFHWTIGLSALQLVVDEALLWTAW
jgi:hypothetical protein